MKRKALIQLEPHRPALRRVERRHLLKGSLSLGALTMLTGCNLQDGDAVDRVLWAMSRWNDRVQAWLFDPNRLAPTYPASSITKPFPFNAFYPVDDAPEIDGDDYALEVSGLVTDKQSWTLARLRTLPQESQITRHICIEGWSAIGQWSGVPFRVFLRTRRRGSSSPVCRLQMRRSLLREHRHGDGVAPPDDTGTGLRQCTPAGKVRISNEAAGADEAGFQKSQTYHGALCDQRLPGRILGGSGLQLVQWILTRGNQPVGLAISVLFRNPIELVVWLYHRNAQTLPIQPHPWGAQSGT